MPEKLSIRNPITGKLELVGQGNPINVAGKSTTITVTPVLSLTAYAPNDNVGGKLTLSNAVRYTGGTGLLQGIYLVDKDNQKPALGIVLFESNPTVATITDNLAYAAGTDLIKEIGFFQVATTDWITVNGTTRAQPSINPGIIKTTSGVDIYAAAILISGAATWTTTSSLQIKFGILQD